MSWERNQLYKLARIAGGSAPAGRLITLAALRREADGLIAEEVARLRAEEGWSWAEVGQWLGVTKQAAQQRYGRG